MNTFELLPTEENLIKALKENLLKRNHQIVHFYNLLQAQETSATIAIDGRWGSGKTFFVKQTMLVINAKNPMSMLGEGEDENEEKKAQITCFLPFKHNEEDNDNYDLAIYYDAWENDNDTEPIMSLIYEISKQLGTLYVFDEDTNVFKTAGAILDIIKGKNVNGIIDNLKCDNPLSRFKEQKELDEKMKTFFTDVLAERGNRLVIFIDELDRCKPSFAVHLLEQIKHYLCDERIIFVFSVNLQELQHTIKHYYGDSFDACRYLDRFFDLRIELPPADKRGLYDKIGLNDSYALEKVTQRFINIYNMELREITRFYRQVRTAVYNPTHTESGWDFSFSEGKGHKFMLMCLVPVVVGLKMVDISLYYQFISGSNGKPLIAMFNTEEFIDWFIARLLNKDESFEKEAGKRQVSPEEKIMEMYNAIFGNDYSSYKYREVVGEYEFDAGSKQYLISAASMLSDYVDYDI